MRRDHDQTLADRGAPLPVDVLGSGPPVVLLHGVAFGPRTFDALARMLAGSATVIVVHRPGYGRAESIGVPSRLFEQRDRLAEAIQAVTDERVTLVGVSGGATLTLAVALAAPQMVKQAIVHEPAIGSLAPRLTRMLSDAAASFEDRRAVRDSALALAGHLAGGAAWDAAEVVSHAETMAREVPQFASFDLDTNQLGRLSATPIVSSVGAHSGPERKQVSECLVAYAGAREAVIACGHLAQVEAPRELADLVLREAIAS